MSGPSTIQPAPKLRTSNYTTATDTRTESMSWTHRKIKQASERARQRVNIRWNRVRAEQAKMDAAPMPARRAQNPVAVSEWAE